MTKTVFSHESKIDLLRRASSAGIADEATVYDNSSASGPLKIVATYRSSNPMRSPTWPTSVPGDLVEL